MIFHKVPRDFNPRFEIVSCYIECGGQILLLHRPEHKSQGGKWGLPAGKVDSGETHTQALLREVKEETGLSLTENDIRFLSSVYVRFPDYDFIYHMHHTTFSQLPEVTINREEHQNYTWITPAEALALDLVTDQDTCIKMYY